MRFGTCSFRIYCLYEIFEVLGISGCGADLEALVAKDEEQAKILVDLRGRTCTCPKVIFFLACLVKCLPQGPFFDISGLTFCIKFDMF